MDACKTRPQDSSLESIRNAEKSAKVIPQVGRLGFEYAEWRFPATRKNQVFEKRRCAATLITDSILLTAAHCVFYRTGVVSSTLRRNFEFHTTFDDRTYRVSASPGGILVHPKYKEISTAEFDLALLKLEEPVKLPPATSPLIPDINTETKDLTPAQDSETSIVSYHIDPRALVTFNETGTLLFSMVDDLSKSWVFKPGPKNQLPCSGDSGSIAVGVHNGINYILAVASKIQGTEEQKGKNARSLTCAEFASAHYTPLRAHAGWLQDSLSAL